MADLKLTNVAKAYGGVKVLSNINLDIRKGELIVFVGPSGCGKSTLLRLLAFLERPAAGTLRYTGKAASRQEVTLLLQEPYLLRMSVFNNVVLGLRLRHDAAQAHSAYEQCMRAVGFDSPWDFAQRGPVELSGGERQRVALASRLALRPAVLLLDEPTANVDAASALAVVSAIEACRNKGVTVICATHDPALIRMLGARELQLGRHWSEAGV